MMNINIKIKIIQIKNEIIDILSGKRKTRRLLLTAMKKSGQSMPRIRKSLMQLHDISISKLANGEVGQATIYNTLGGKQQNPVAMELLANSMGYKVKELFPEK